MIRKVVLAAGFALLMGCATGTVYTPAPTPAPGNAHVTVIRGGGVLRALYPNGVMIDGKQVATLRAGGYTWFEVPAGEHSVCTFLGAVCATRNLADGGRYHFVISPAGAEFGYLGPTTRYTPRIQLVPEARARALLGKSRFEPPTAAALAPAR